MAFSFNFSGEDIDDSIDHDGDAVSNSVHIDAAKINGGDVGEKVEVGVEVEVKQWDLREMVRLLFL